MKGFEHVLSPFRIGSIEVKNRLELAPHCSSLGSPDGFVTKELIAYYQSVARGGTGIVTIGETPVDYHYAKRHEYLLNISDERIVSGLCYLAEAVNRYGAKLSMELSHAGAMQMHGGEAIGPSPVSPKIEYMLAKAQGREKTKVIEMTQGMIDDVIDSFATAAERCLYAGLEMIMLHGAHGHLISQFLSPNHNKRVDEYGGSLENRARFVLELLAEIRKRVGNRIAIEYRISATDKDPGGMGEEETLEFAKMIEDKIDLLHVSTGTMNNPDASLLMIAPTYCPHCTNVHYAERFKKELSVPIATVGSISDMQSAESIVAEGKADIIVMARAIIADHQIVNKTMRGENIEVRPCLRCNQCTLRTRNCVPLRCTVDPTIGRETDYSTILPAPKKKKVAIAGGGPAGMMAALTASSRGHEAVLFEKSAALGGNLIVASGPDFKDDMKKYLEWLVRQVNKDSNVTIKLETEATPEKIKAENPDAVIIAVGADPLVPEALVKGRNNVVLAGDVHVDKATTGETVVVAGGGLTGCEVALHLAQNGKKVTIIDMLDMKTLTVDTPRAFVTMLNENGVRFLTEVRIDEITDSGVTIIDKTLKRVNIPADTVVLSFGYVPRSGVVDTFRNIVPDTYFIGDCRKPNDLFQAIHDAFNIAVEI